MSKYYDDHSKLLRDKFSEYQKDTTRPMHSEICDLYRLYDGAMSWFYSKGDYEIHKEDELKDWREKLELAGVRSHKIYLQLKEKWIEVKHDKDLMKNRIEACGQKPDNLDFYLHHDAVEDLLNFCIIGTAEHKQIKKLRKEHASTKKTPCI
jgi:hypothetical protein